MERSEHTHCLNLLVISKVKVMGGGGAIKKCLIIRDNYLRKSVNNPLPHICNLIYKTTSPL